MCFLWMEMLPHGGTILTGAILVPVKHLCTKLPPKTLILPLIKAPASVLYRFEWQKAGVADILLPAETALN